LVFVRLDRGLLQLVDQGMLLRSLPNPLTPAEQARLRDARPAGPAPRRLPSRCACSDASPAAARWSLPSNASTSVSSTPDGR
jgi:hypothetical protein